MQNVDSVEDCVVSRLQFGHSRVHLCVHQPKSKRFVSHQGLVVALVVRNVFLSIDANQSKAPSLPPIGDRVRNVRHVPELQLALLHQFYPFIYQVNPTELKTTGHCHIHSVVESDSAILHRRGEKRVSGNIFGNGERRRLERMKKTVRHGQIGQSINVHLTVIVCERSDIAVKPEVFLVVSTKSAPNGVIVVDD